MNAPQLPSDASTRRLALMNRRSIWLFAITVAMLSESLLAQNPLRAQATQTREHYSSQNSKPTDYETPLQQQLLAIPERDRATSSPDNRSAIERISQQASDANWASNPRYDDTVKRAGFNAPANIEHRSAQRPTVNQSLLQPQPQIQLPTESPRKPELAPNFIERENNAAPSRESQPTPKKENLGQLISKLGMNLAFVLFLAIGGILVVKQWIKPQSVRRSIVKDSDSDPLSMQIVETLRIDAKTTLHLVECGTSSVLVATDAGGLKSVNLLSPSFDRALLEDAATQEQVVSSDNGASPRKVASHIQRAYQKETSEPKPSLESNSKSDGMDEKLIRMLLESSKKRKIAG